MGNVLLFSLYCSIEVLENIAIKDFTARCQTTESIRWIPQSAKTLVPRCNPLHPTGLGFDLRYLHSALQYNQTNKNKRTKAPMDSISFRAAYSSGVGTYYAQNASTYRNPHESGVAKSLRAILEVLIPPNHPPPVRIFDLSSGSGEATLAATRFLQTHRPALASSAIINASDPYTHELYTTRTGLPCGKENFKDILLEGRLKGGRYDVVICSFALHLCSKGEIWGLLYALSLSSRWFVVLAPGKGPEVGADTGWERKGKEIMVERVRGRVYRSLNFVDDQRERGECEEKLGTGIVGGEAGADKGIEGTIVPGEGSELAKDGY
ncbi:hypothetical protein HOY82DRAFT_575604 [Tuber indicum]|nr:hypothetical protein HOY82DRAFT_575604 [Tuber indicum]